MSKRAREEGDRELERRDDREVDGIEEEGELQMKKMKKAKNLGGRLNSFTPPKKTLPRFLVQARQLRGRPFPPSSAFASSSSSAVLR
jgi:hypothetical protein